MEQIQANRLVGVINLMENLPKRATFNISHWVMNNKDTQPKPTNRSSLKKAIDCGTSACAVGWAIIAIPAWKKHFTFKTDGDVYLASNPDRALELSEVYSEIAEFLGIKQEESMSMFAPEYYSYSLSERPTPKDVSSHCVKVLNNHGYDLY